MSEQHAPRHGATDAGHQPLADRAVSPVAETGRRQFLQTVGSGAVLAAAGQLRTARSQATSANETIEIACIGVGGRCQHLLRALVRVPGVRIAGVCDVWDKHLDAGRQVADPAAIATKGFREILDRKDIDAVLIATPDHWHTPITIEACAAGKDVYVEKPLTHEPAEGAKVVEAQNKYKRIVQVGTQQRSMPQFQRGMEIVKAGGLGAIHKIHLTWNRNQDRVRRNPLGVDPASVDWQKFLGNAPQQPFDEYRFRNWRWFWDFGGGIFTDLMVHQLDIAHWYLGLDNPASAQSIGDHFMAAGVWETPDTVQTLLHYPAQSAQVYFEGTFSNARNAAMLEFMGTDATLYLDRGRLEVIPERRSKVEAKSMVLGTGPRGADFYDKPDGELLHLTNWVDCIRSRQAPNAPAEAGVSAAAAAHLANSALRSGQIAHSAALAG
jgi:predicted dehydrogenase